MPYKNKCFSKCQGKTRRNCGNKMCRYVDGSTYKYCRLGFKHKLDSNCDIIPKMTKQHAMRKIKKMIHTKKRDKSAKKIQKFLRNMRNNYPSHLYDNEIHEIDSIDSIDSPTKISSNHNEKTKKRNRRKITARICSRISKGISNKTKKMRNACRNIKKFLFK